MKKEFTVEISREIEGSVIKIRDSLSISQNIPDSAIDELKKDCIFRNLNIIKEIINEE